MTMFCTAGLAMGSWWGVERHALRLKALRLRLPTDRAPMAMGTQLPVRSAAPHDPISPSHPHGDKVD